MTTTPTQERNGVDTETLFATIDAVRKQPELARFQFRTTTEWVGGTHNRTTIGGFHGAGTEHEHRQTYTVDADHPAVLVGKDNAPTPAEHLLQALGGCLTSGLANIAAARGIELGEVTARVEGDIDLRGILGLDGAVRNGFEDIRVTFHVRATPRPSSSLASWSRPARVQPCTTCSPAASGCRSTWPPPDDAPGPVRTNAHRSPERPSWEHRGHGPGPGRQHRAGRAAVRGSARRSCRPARAPGVRRAGPPRAAPGPGGAQGRADGLGLGRALRERDRGHQPDQAGPSSTRRRRALPAAMRTLHGRGYRFVADVVETEPVQGHRANAGRAGPRTGTRRSGTPAATACTSPTRSPAAVTSTSS